MQCRSTVAAATNDSYTDASVRTAVHHILESLTPLLPVVVKRGDRVFLKVNMGCSGARDPSQRLTTHPVMAESIIHALLDCGAVVSFGDDVARAGKYNQKIYDATGMSGVAKRTGARLIDFVAAGGREVRGGLLYPRKYLITNAYFEADVVINAATFRSHAGIGISGAIKNMFGCVIGQRKQLIHNIFAGDSRGFSRAIADIYRVVQADLSFLDLTSVVEGAGINPRVRPVGFILASTDAIALDTVASYATGYEGLPMWTTYFGNRFGLGCNDIDRIRIRGIDWANFEKSQLEYPWLSAKEASTYDRITTVVNNTALRPRAVIKSSKCTGCGDCVQRCPVDCIAPAAEGVYRIDLGSCADCGCCFKVCEAEAVNIEFVGVAKAIRILLNRLPEKVDPKASNRLDPAPPAA